MTDPKDGAREGAGSKRPHATLDLKATEVRAPDSKALEAKLGETKEPGNADKTQSAGAPEPLKPSPGPGAGSGTAGGGPESKPSGATAAAAAPRPAHASPAGRGGSMLTHTMAGLVGGALMLAAATRFGPELGLAGASPKEEADLAQLGQRLTVVEEAQRTQPQGAVQTLQAVDERLKRLEEAGVQLGSLGDATARLDVEAKALNEKITALASSVDKDRIAKLEERFQMLAAAAESDTDKSRIQGLAAVTSKVADLADSIEPRLAAERKLIGDAVEQRLAAVAQTGEQARVATERLGEALNQVRSDAVQLFQRNEALKSDIGRLAINLEALKNESMATNSGLSGLEAAVKSQLQAVARPADVMSALTPLSTKLEAMEKRIDAMVSAEDERKSNASRIVLALELASLKRAIERGQPYARELEAVRKAAPQTADFGALDATKDEGVPSIASLQRDFKPVIRAMLDADAVPAEGSLLERLAASAKSAIKVRKTSHEDGDNSAEAVATRMEAALAAGKLDDVIAISSGLPAAAAALAQGWLANVKRRLAADQAIADLEGEVKASLSGRTSAPADTLQN